MHVTGIQMLLAMRELMFIQRNLVKKKEKIGQALTEWQMSLKEGMHEVRSINLKRTTMN